MQYLHALHGMQHVLGPVAATFSIMLIWPQVWLSVRQRRTNGLSPTATWLSAALSLCWFTYGVLLGDPVQMITNGVVGAANIAILAALLITQPHLRVRRRVALHGWGAGALLTAALTAAFGAAVLGVLPAEAAVPLGSLASVIGALNSLPQPLSLLRDRTQDLSGLSPLRYALNVFSCIAWVGYGLGTGQTSVWASAAVGLLGAITVCAVLAAAGRFTVTPSAMATVLTLPTGPEALALARRKARAAARRVALAA